jgi:hypothetical protein
MTQASRLARIAGILLVGTVAFYFVTRVPPDEAAHAYLNSDLARVLEAQQAFLVAHHRYARTLTELALDYHPFHSEIRLEEVTDSSFRVVGVVLRYPGVTCMRQVTPATRAQDGMLCWGHALPQ